MNGGTHELIVCKTSIIFSIITAGPIAAPSLHPVIAKALLNPFAIIILFLHASCKQIEKNFSGYPKTILAYISSLRRYMSFSSAIFAISINSSGSIHEPVGLLGELIIINLVFEVILARKSSGLSLNALCS